MKFFTPRTKTMLIAMVILFCTYANSAVAQTKAETINAGYFFTFGRFTTAPEAKYWMGLPNYTLAQYIAANRAYLKTNANERSQTLYRAFMDSFGATPAQTDINFFANKNVCYADIVGFNMNTTCVQNRPRRELVIVQSYLKVFNRAANATEINDWMRQPLYTYVQLVAFHTSWLAKHPGALVAKPAAPTIVIKPNTPASQTASKTATTAPASAIVNLSAVGPLLVGTAATVTTTDLGPSLASGIVAQGGGNIVAQGGGNIIAASQGNIVAQGGGNIVAQGGGN